MRFSEKRSGLIALAITAVSLLSACGSESSSSYADVDESEAQTALGADFTVPIYPSSTLYEVKKADGMGKMTITGSFHSDDKCPDISDWYSRRLRMKEFVVTGIEKADTSCEVIANKGKEECKLTANGSSSPTTITITYSKPK